MRWALRAMRLERHWTQEHLAKTVGISRSYYSMIEYGKRDPTLHLAARMAEILDVDIPTLFF